MRDLGRGLLAIGGDTSFGQGDYIGTPLDDALPVRSSVRSHRDQGRVALLLVIDRLARWPTTSTTKAPPSWTWRKQAAILSAQQLAPRDRSACSTFDSSQHWILPLTTMLGLGPTAVQDRLGAACGRRRHRHLPGAVQAFDAIKDTDARYKHIILMSDGMSCCGGDYPGLLDRHARGERHPVDHRRRRRRRPTAADPARPPGRRPLLLRRARPRHSAADDPRNRARHARAGGRGRHHAARGRRRRRPRRPSPPAACPRSAGTWSPPPRISPRCCSSRTQPTRSSRAGSTAWDGPSPGPAICAGAGPIAGMQWPGTAQLFSELVGWTIAPNQGPLRLNVRADAPGRPRLRRRQ